MKFLQTPSLFVFTLLLVGCTSTPQQAIDFSLSSLSNDQSITVTTSEVPSPTMAYPGAGCLLCLGVAATANSNLSSHAKTLPTDELESLGSEVVASLEKQKVTVKLAEATFLKKELKKSASKTINAAKKDHSPLKSQFNTSHLLVIDFDYVGISRNYANYVPTSEPYAQISGAAYLVNLDTNEYEWYLPILEKNYSDGDWKEKPNYPTLSNAYYEAVARVREAILSAISTQ